MHTTTSVYTCSCGESEPHVIARRRTADGIGVDFWHDGAITGLFGRALPGVPVARPRSAEGLALTQATANLVAGEIELYDLADLPRLVDVARRVAKRGGLPGDLRAAFHAADEPTIRLVWTTYETDRDGAPTVRVARLDRIRWPGLVVWHERGHYEVMALRQGSVLGGRSREALVDTGFSFATQRDLCAHLAAVARPIDAAAAPEPR
jgi:hypothetical protein